MKMGKFTHPAFPWTIVFSMVVMLVPGASGCRALSALPRSDAKVWKGATATTAPEGLRRLFPAIVPLDVMETHRCTGIFLSPRTIVTAAHCVRVSGRTLVHQPALGGQTPESILIPPAWDEGDLSQDLALLVFGQPLGTQRGISVYPRMGGNINVGDPVFIAGYGFNEHRQKPGEILWGTNKVRSLSAQYIDVKGMDEGDFPAGDDVTAAPGDSGGPIFDTRFNLVGITSRGCLPEEGCSLRVSEHLRLEGTLGRWISPRIQ